MENKTTYTIELGDITAKCWTMKAIKMLKEKKLPIILENVIAVINNAKEFDIPYLYYGLNKRDIEIVTEAYEKLIKEMANNEE